MTDSGDPTAWLQEIGRSDEPVWPLAEAALNLAALDHPGRGLTPYMRHLEELGRSLARAPADSAGDRADALASLLHVEHGYQGDNDNYDDMANADLMAVIDRRRGLPVALAILYIDAARRAGWPAWGLDMPGHFVIRIDGDSASERAIVDPFHAGVQVETGTLRQLIKTYVGPDAELEPSHYEPMEDRAVLLRLLNNIRGRALQADDPDRGLEIMDRMLLIAPAIPQLWLESAAIKIKAGQLMGAREAVNRCMALDEEGQLRAPAERLLQSLRRDLN